jgi:hypothetical protein
MSDPGPLPEPRRGRRTWLWIIGGLLAACVLVCCGFFVFVSTVGEDWWEGVETSIAEAATEQADE